MIISPPFRRVSLEGQNANCHAESRDEGGSPRRRASAEALDENSTLMALEEKLFPRADGDEELLHGGNEGLPRPGWRGI